jgi:hypothetical protein
MKLIKDGVLIILAGIIMNKEEYKTNLLYSFLPPNLEVVNSCVFGRQPYPLPALMIIDY